MSNVQTAQAIADALLESMRSAAQILLNTPSSTVVGNIVNRIEAAVDLLAISVTRFQTVSDLIKNAQKEGRDLTPEEVSVAEGFYDASLQSVKDDLK